MLLSVMSLKRWNSQTGFLVHLNAGLLARDILILDKALHNA